SAHSFLKETGAAASIGGSPACNPLDASTGTRPSSASGAAPVWGGNASPLPRRPTIVLVVWWKRSAWSMTPRATSITLRSPTDIGSDATSFTGWRIRRVTIPVERVNSRQRDLVQRIRANGIDFTYLDNGAGPLVLLLHGFPDSARSWSYQTPALAAAGYRAVAPYLRGYPPTEVPREGFSDMGTLATDVAELIRGLGAGTPVQLVGQDWGAAITYSVVAAHPELVRRAVVMAVPHRASWRFRIGRALPGAFSI